MNRLDKILIEKKMKRVNWDELAELLPIESAGLRAAFSRGQVSPVYLDIIEKKLGITSPEQRQDAEGKPKKDALSIEEIITQRLIEEFTPMIKKMFSDHEERVNELEVKQQMLRKDFHIMFERQLSIDGVAFEDSKEKTGSSD